MKRDKYVNETLENDGWVVLRFWGEDVKKNLNACINRVLDMIDTQSSK